METIKEFIGEFRFLSNFYLAAVSYEDELYPSVENAYQAAKTEDKALRRAFLDVTPAKAKKMGRKLRLRRDWDQVKERIMEMLLFEKFSVHRDLGEKLLATGQASLIEGNWWGDRYWGVFDGQGQNRLGVLLMRVRAKLEKIKQQTKSAAGYE